MPTAGQREPAANNTVDQLEFERLLSEISSRFVKQAPGDVDREIGDALRDVCKLLGLDLAVLWQWSADARDAIVPTHAYPSLRDLPLPEPILQEHYPWTIRQMLAGRTIVLASLDDSPAEASIDREFARRAGIKSTLTLPLAVGGEPPIGAVALSTLRAERNWPGVVVTRLQLVAQVFTNALARRRHELNLQESEQRGSLAADAAEAGLWSLDYRTGVFWASARARGIFGYAPDESITLGRLESLVHPDDWPIVRDAVERSARDAEPINVDYRIVVGDDGVRWITSRGRPRLSSTGEPDCLMGVSVDITERKRAEEALHRSEARLESGAALAGLGFYEVDFGAGSMYVDDRLRDLCAVPPDCDGLHILDFWMRHVHHDDTDRMLALREQMHAGTVEQFSFEYRYLHPTRGELWIHHHAAASARNAAGRAIRTYGVLRDVTEHRRAVEDLRRSYLEIEQLKDRLQAETDYLKAEIGVAHAQSEVTGQSAAIRTVLRQVEQVAPTGSSVLVCGETGTGKERVAQAIHRLSPRRDRVMVKVNCAALPAGLVESELFGREKGAFTGAMTRQIGRFEVADGSTLFLDEIGELSLDLQAKLLRVLETGEFERLGSPRTITVNVRLIAATNRDLTEEIHKGRFREDLYYRLNVFPIRVPPLRERTEDIPALVWTLLGELSTRMGKRITRVPRKTMEGLQRRPWPGNVRELRNVIEYGAIITTGTTLAVPLLAAETSGGALPQTLADVEREHILRVLERTGWRIMGPNGAAEELGLNRGTLYGRMRKLGIPLPHAKTPGA